MQIINYEVNFLDGESQLSRIVTQGKSLYHRAQSGILRQSRGAGIQWRHLCTGEDSVMTAANTPAAPGTDAIATAKSPR